MISCLQLKLVKLEILLTSFIDFLSDMLGELRSGSLGLGGLIRSIFILDNAVCCAADCKGG